MLKFGRDSTLDNTHVYYQTFHVFIVRVAAAVFGSIIKCKLSLFFLLSNN